MKTHASRGVASALLCAVTLGWMTAGTAASAEPYGFSRVRVKGTPLSIALPDSWTNHTLTRSAATQYLKEYPKVAESGVTVKSLLAQPLISGVDLDGNGYLDRTLVVDVGVTTGMPDTWDLKISLQDHGAWDITVKRSAVGDKPALIATFKQDTHRDGGVTHTYLGTAYLFIPEGKDSVMLTFATGSLVDRVFPTMVDTMIKSVKVE